MLSELRKPGLTTIIDTTGMKVSEFNARWTRCSLSQGRWQAVPLLINIISFGYKHGIPQETDLVFDMRFIPNPFYVQSLKHLTGNNKKVSQYVMKQEVTKKFIKQLDKLINTDRALLQEGRQIPFEHCLWLHRRTASFGCYGQRDG
jgi:UPF0042 nucleotide-binding protein